MLDTDKLLALELPKLPLTRRDAVYRAPKVRYLVRTQYAENKSMLIVAFFDRESALNGFQLPSAVLYLTRDDYTTLVIENGKRKWRNKKLRHSLKLKSDEQIVPISLHDINRVYAFTNTYNDTPSIDDCIISFQAGIMQEKAQKKKLQRADDYERELRITPALPKTLMRWIENGPLKSSRYIYFSLDAGELTRCFCTHCHQDVPAFIPKHNQTGICPACGSAITFKNAARATALEDQTRVCVMQKVPQTGEYLLRYFAVHRSYRGARCWNPKTELYEDARLFFTGKGEITRQFKHGNGNLIGRMGWYPNQDILLGRDTAWERCIGCYQYTTNVWFKPAFLYPHNMHNILTECGLSYDTKKWLYGQRRNVTTYILQNLRYPFALSLKKLGFSELSEDILRYGEQLNFSERTGPLHKCLHLTKESLAMVKAQNGDIDTVNFLSLFYPQTPSEDDLRWLEENKVPHQHLAFLLRYGTITHIRRYVKKQIRKCGIKGLADNPVVRCVIFWKDYLQMAEQLGYDTHHEDIIYPPHVKDEHDKLSELVKVKFDKNMDIRIKRVYPQLDKLFSYADDQFLIRPPVGFQEFIEEGATLHHCVCTNGYYKQHVNPKETVILLVRKKEEPDTPFYTMEYNPFDHSIVQLQGYRHCGATDEVKAFARVWQRMIRRAPAEADKEAAA